MFSPAGILTLSMILILLIKRRVTREEQELTKAFDKEWIQYAAKTKRFIPRII